MPEENVLEQARKDKEEGKSPSTQAGEFVREEIHHVREGKHSARSPQQAIAIGLSKARRAGVKLPRPRQGSVPAKTRAQAKRDTRQGRQSANRKTSRVRSRAAAASRASLSKHARTSARRRSAQSRRNAAKRSARARKENRR